MTPTSSNPACTTEFVEIDANDSQNPAQSEQTHRYALRVVPAPRRSGMPLNPELHGAALILGVNPLSESLAEKIRQLGQKAIVLDTSVPIGQIENSLNELWQHTATPHLFLTMAFDVDSARTLQESEWRRRRPAALESPFRICQLWMQKTIDASLMEKASVVSVTQLGGDFGFSGKHVRCVEAIGGLVKAMLIEAWMRGFRTTPMKIVDVTEGMKPQDIVSGVLQELAVPSYDMEIALRSGPQPHAPERYSVQAMAAPLDSARSAMQHGMTNRVTRGGTWIVSGGGRGITAVIAMTLAKKYDLKLHLLGTAPVPNLSDEFVRMVAQDRSGVRRSIMNDASARGENPVEAWRNAEKAIEVDATLRECRKQNVKATYYCCDVSDFTEVADIVGQIRRTGGPIQGVIHGAGAGQDARFDRKRPDKVEKCLRAKIDGTFALMQATRQDPLQWFVTFGSISGRFGANGHTDYSLANDMMAKIVDRYRTERPEVRSLTFHWHAWGDIGMATKPEAKLALEMIDMEFMPARDGIAHFMNELEYGGEEPEVLITDESYFRKFFPAERLSVSSTKSGSLPVPLIPGTVTQHGDGVCSSVITLNPVTDKFLSQHRVQSRPTLPFVVALELMAEAVRVRTGTGDAGICLRARAMQAIRFSTEDPLAITVQTRPTPQGGIECRLLADVRRRDGRMVEEDREYFRAEFLPRDKALSASTSAQRFEKPANVSWKKIEYVSPEGLIYHGPELQELREITDDGTTIFGRIAASAAVQLFGGTRARGFTVPCATMDACLYAIGYAAWQRHQKPSLPVEFEHIEFGRLPDPGEPCLVRIQQTHLSDSGAIWNFQLQGHNGDRLLTVSGYRIGWLKTS
jgi:NAD(P)-dependent dehydrogenase (short-subunit alcohol dehydrogenase family)